MNKNTNTQAFTIVELLVVIVVIGILAAITIVSYSGVTKRAKIASLQSDLSNASQQLKMFKTTNTNEDYPTTIDCTIPDSATNKCIKSSSNNLYTYTVDNASIPKTFKITATNNSLVYRVVTGSQVSGPWIAGKVGTTLAGKYVMANNLASKLMFKTSDTAVTAPQGSIGVDLGSLTEIALVSPQQNPLVDFSEYPAQNACKNIGGRLPYVNEIQDMYTDKVLYGDNFLSGADTNPHMTATEATFINIGWYQGKRFTNGFWVGSNNRGATWVRCVAD